MKESEEKTLNCVVSYFEKHGFKWVKTRGVFLRGEKDKEIINCVLFDKYNQYKEPAQ